MCHYTSNLFPERSPPGYCFYHNPWYDQRNHQSHCRQSVRKTILVVHISQPFRSRGQVTGQAYTIIPDPSHVLLWIISATKSFWHKKEKNLLWNSKSNCTRCICVLWGGYLVRPGSRHIGPGISHLPVVTTGLKDGRPSHQAQKFSWR